MLGLNLAIYIENTLLFCAFNDKRCSSKYILIYWGFVVKSRTCLDLCIWKIIERWAGFEISVLEKLKNKGPGNHTQKISSWEISKSVEKSYTVEYILSKTAGLKACNYGQNALHRVWFLKRLLDFSRKDILKNHFEEMLF